MFRCCLGSLLWRQCGCCEHNRYRKWGLSTYIIIYTLGQYRLINTQHGGRYRHAWPFSQSLPFPFSHPVHDQGVIHIMSVGPFTETLREFTQPLDQIKEADVIHKLGVDKSDGRVDRWDDYLRNNQGFETTQMPIEWENTSFPTKHRVTLFL